MEEQFYQVEKGEPVSNSHKDYLSWKLRKISHLMAFDETGKVFNASAGGDNCAKWIVRISEEKELTISLHNIMSFEGIDFKAQILNDGRIVNNYSEHLDAATDFLQG